MKSIDIYNFNTTPCVPESNNPIGRVDEMLAVRSRSQKARLGGQPPTPGISCSNETWLAGKSTINL
jgi:hypothetical protein